jgi:membrane fusion protein (multidrug efflux system)
MKKNFKAHLINLKLINKKQKLFIGIGILLFLISIFLLMPSTIKTDNAYVRGTKIIVFSEVSGVIKSIHVEDNQKVKKDDLLIKIDDTDLNFQIGKAKANYDFTIHEMNRQEALEKQKFSAKSQYEQILRNHLINEILLNELEYKLSKTQIKAPISGTVARMKLEPGQYIEAYRPLFYIVNDNNIWVEANLKETDIYKVKKGQKVKVAIDSYPDKTFDGVVDSVSPSTGSEFAAIPIDNSYGNFIKIVQRIPIKIKILHDTELLKPGMSAVVKINVK